MTQFHVARADEGKFKGDFPATWLVFVLLVRLIFVAIIWLPFVSPPRVLSGPGCQQLQPQIGRSGSSAWGAIDTGLTHSGWELGVECWSVRHLDIREGGREAAGAPVKWGCKGGGSPVALSHKAFVYQLGIVSHC